MVLAYFTQAEATFVSMDKAMKAKEHLKLASLGHFLKGSSATLGLTKVADLCEKIQHHGELRDTVSPGEVTIKALNKDDALAEIGSLLKKVKEEYVLAEKWLRAFYADPKALASNEKEIVAPPASPPPPASPTRKSESGARPPAAARKSTNGARKSDASV